MAPPDDGALTDDKHLLTDEPCSRRSCKILPVRQACRLSDETGSVRGGVRILDHAIVRHQVLHGPGIVMVECVMKFPDDLAGCKG